MLTRAVIVAFYHRPIMKARRVAKLVELILQVIETINLLRVLTFVFGRGLKLNFSKCHFCA